MPPTSKRAYKQHVLAVAWVGIWGYTEDTADGASGVNIHTNKLHGLRFVSLLFYVANENSGLLICLAGAVLRIRKGGRAVASVMHAIRFWGQWDDRGTTTLKKRVMTSTWSILVAPEAAVKTTSGAATNDKVGSMTVFVFQSLLWSNKLGAVLILSHVVYPINIFALPALSGGNPPVIGGFPSQSPVTRDFHIFFDLRLHKRLNKQSRRRWFGTPLSSSWRHCNVIIHLGISFALYLCSSYLYRRVF